MKKIKFLGLSIMSLLLFAFQCDSDDDVTLLGLNNANLAGTYNITALTGDSIDIENLGGTTATETATFVASDFNNATITFTEAGAVTSTGSYTLTATFIEDGMTDTEVDVEDVDLNTTYTLSGNTIVFADNDGETTTITNFTGNGLQLVLVDSETDIDGFFELNATFTLVKQ